MPSLLAILFFLASLAFGFAGIYQENKKMIFVAVLFAWGALLIAHFFIMPLDQALNARS